MIYKYLFSFSPTFMKTQTHLLHSPRNPKSSNGFSCFSLFWKGLDRMCEKLLSMCALQAYLDRVLLKERLILDGWKLLLMCVFVRLILMGRRDFGRIVSYGF